MKVVSNYPSPALVTYSPQIVSPNNSPALPAVTSEAPTKDPLSIDKLDVLLFAASAYMWSVKYINNDQLDSATLIKLTAGKIIVSGLRLFKSMQTWKGFFAHQLLKAGLVGAGVFMPEVRPAAYVFNAFTIGHLAHSALSGLATCWKNAADRPVRAMLKALVTHLPTAVVALDKVSELSYKNFEQSTFTDPLQRADEVIISKEQKEACELLPDDKQCLPKLSETRLHCIADPNSKACLAGRAYFMPHMDYMHRNTACLKNGYHISTECTTKSRALFDLCFKDDTSEACKDGRDAFANYQQRTNYFSEQREKYFKNNAKTNATAHVNTTATHDVPMETVLRSNYLAACEKKLETPACEIAEDKLREYLNGDTGTATNNDGCPKIGADKLATLNVKSAADRVLDPTLKPSCPEHAKVILMGSAEDLNCKSAKRVYLKLQKEFHPDRVSEKELATTITQKIGPAWETVKKQFKC